MKLAKVIALLALTAPGIGRAAGDSPPAPAMRPNLDPNFALTTTVLDFPTGLRVLIQEDHSHPVATVYTYVGHGFNDDPPGAEETAHFVEHTWFRSVHSDDMPPIMFLIQDLGTLFNATTAADRTDYRTTANVQYLPLLVKLESLRLTDFYRGVTEEQVDVEREVIRNEWRRRNEQNVSQIIDFLNEVVYPEGHPYARASTHESLNQIKLQTLHDYVDTFYKPSDTTITIIGDFNTPDLIQMILENFDLKLLDPELTEDHVKVRVTRNDQTVYVAPSEAQPGEGLLVLMDPRNPGQELSFLFDKNRAPAPRVREEVRDEPPPVGTHELVTRKGPVDHRTVLVGWSLPAGYHSDHFNLTSLGGVASQYVWGGLHSSFGEKDLNWREGVGCFVQPQLLASTMMCYVEVKNPKIDAEMVAEKVIDQMAAITDPDQAQQFNLFQSRGKQEAIKDLLESVDLVAAVFGSRAESIGEYAHWTGDPNYYSRAMRNIMNVEGTKIAELAHNYLRRDRAAMLVVEPLKGKEIDVTSQNSSYAGTSEGDAVIESSDDLSLAERPMIAGAFARPDLSGLVDTTLPNGLHVMILPHGEAPKVNVQLVFGGGNSEAPYGQAGMVSRYAKSVGEDPLAIAGTPSYYYQPSFLGLSIPEAYPLLGGMGGTNFRLGLTAPSGNVDGAMWILRREIETVSPYMSGWKTEIKNSYDRLEGNWFESAWHQGKLQNDHLYPGEARYASTTWEELDARAEWGGSDVRSFLDRHLHPENATLIVVGDVDAEAVVKQAETYFGGWKAASEDKATRPQLEMPAMPTAPARTVIFDDEKRTQTQTNLVCRLNTRGVKDEAAVDVLGSMLGNQVFATLRVKEGLAYSPGAFAFTRADGSALLAFQSLAVNKGVGRTVEFFRHAVERVAKGDIDPAEVKLHQLRINRSEGVGNQSVDQVSSMLAGAVTQQKKMKELELRGERIASVTATDLTRLVEGCLDHAYISLEGPKDVITAQLDERGLPYEIFDYEQAGMDLLWKYDKKEAKKRKKAKDKADAEKAAAEAEEGEADEGKAEPGATTSDTGTQGEASGEADAGSAETAGASSGPDAGGDAGSSEGDDAPK